MREFKTRGPWWFYIAHLSKQLCKLTFEVSAKFTALWFLYKFNSLLPSGHVFFMHHDGLKWILKEGHQTNNSAKLHWNWSSGFWQKGFWSVSYSYIGKISPTPNGHFFWRIMTAWTNLVEGHQRNIPAKLYWNRFSGYIEIGPVVSDKKIF